MKNGDTFEKWTVINYVNTQKVFCQCECGKTSWVSAHDLIAKKSTQCRLCAVSNPHSEVGRLFAHLQKAVLKKVWDAAKNAIDRCTNSAHRRYADWGGRGIKVQFPSVTAFVEYLFSLPGCEDSSLVLDRINNDKHYEPGNLRFVTRSVSQLNRRVQSEHGYYMTHGFARSFKKLHDKGMSFKIIGNLYCAGMATVRNCVRQLETGNAFGC